MAPLFQAGQEAHGIIAVGQFATGVIAIGQVATGAIAIGQVARGGVAIGMVALGLVTIGMGSAGLLHANGIAVVGGQVGFGLRKVPLVPPLRAPASLSGWSRVAWWRLLGGLQLLALAALAWGFWLLAGVPVGDALLGPGGLLR